MGESGEGGEGGEGGDVMRCHGEVLSSTSVFSISSDRLGMAILRYSASSNYLLHRVRLKTEEVERWTS